MPIRPIVVSNPDDVLVEMLAHGSDAVCLCGPDLVVRHAAGACAAVLGGEAAEITGHRFTELVAAADAADVEAIRDALLSGADHAAATHRLLRPGGQMAWAETRGRRMTSDPGLLQLTVRDVTEWHRVTEDLRDLLADQGALRRVATAIASCDDPSTVFALVAEEIGTALGADTASVSRAGDDDVTVVAAWSRDPRQSVPSGARLPLGGGSAVARSVRTRRPVRTEGVPGLEGTIAAAWPLESSVAVPVRSQGRLWGAVSVHTSHGRQLSRTTEGRLARFSELVALAVVSAEALEQLSRLAAEDHLTGLLNRRSFDRRLAEEMERARRHGRELSLVAFDIDCFKRINDTYGHATGDGVLTEVAHRLAAHARTGDVLARVGGEEFAWLMPDTGGDGALLAADRARLAVRSQPIGAAGVVTISAGVAAMSPGDDAAKLRQLADEALYAAKRYGRDASILNVGAVHAVSEAAR